MLGSVERFLTVSALLGLFIASAARADELSGRIRGLVSDPSGAVLPAVQLTATNTATKLSWLVVSRSDGSFEFLSLPIGDYGVTATRGGFKVYSAKGIILAVNQIYVLNVRMEVGQVTEEARVEVNPAQVESTSMQLGTVIPGQTIVDMPLNGRDWIQLQQLQPGVVSQSDRFQDAYATNGSQSQQNSFLINGTDSNDITLNTPLATPSPDAIAEFRLVTNTINPEYGRNSGAVLNAIIKSGSNSLHGSLFEFYRDTSLNATRYFFLKPEVFHRNQFGGTVGGPIWKNHSFFFFSYQGSHTRRAEDVNDTGSSVNGLAQVFTNAERGGDFSEGAAGCPFGTNASPFSLVDSHGITQPAGTQYCTLWPSGKIDPVDFNPVALNLMEKYVPLPNSGLRDYSFNPVHTEVDNQYIARLDHSFRYSDSIWWYMLFESRPTQDTLPFSGPTLPGFASISQSQTKQFATAWNHNFGVNTLNELRVGYSRLNLVLVEPATPELPSSAGFTGIIPQNQKDAGLPAITVAGLFILGFSNDGPQPRIVQTYQITDNFSRNLGRHSLKFGFEWRRFEVNNPFSAGNNGNFSFNGSGPYSTGVPGADFLLGIPDSYAQGSGGRVIARAYEYYAYGQDQLKLRSDLILTFGAGWQVDTPLTDLFNHARAINCFRPGQQSIVFPTAPVGLVFPGDPGCRSAGYVTHYGHVGPRVGFAWSPNLGYFSGGPGKLAIRGGYGIYFNRSEEEITLLNLSAPPFALADFGIGDVGGVPSFTAPFTDITGSMSIPNKYPFVPPAAGSKVDFGIFEPMSLNTLDPNFTTPTTMNYNLTVERELPGRAILSVAYVGSLARHTVIAYELNPGLNPQGCATNPTCVQFRSIQNILFPNNFKYPGNIFGSIGEQSTVGNSNYNSLQASVNKHFTHGLQFLASYTWSHSLDDSSSFENSSFGPRGTNPFNLKSDYGDSEFDARHRFVVSYSYELPGMDTGDKFISSLLSGWKIAGITTLQAGFPVTIADNFGFHSLTCVIFEGYSCWDVPNQVGSIRTLDPRTQPNYWFDPNAFAVEANGTIGNARRNFFHGPGLNNSDFAIYKDTRFGSDPTKRLEVRLEMFNVANHAQFQSTRSIPDGNINDGTFGRILSANPPRLVQLGVKYYF